MKCATLSIKDIEEMSIEFSNEISKEFQPDIVVYVAKAGFLLGYYISKKMGVPLIGVETVREKGNRLKDKVAPIIRFLPNFIRNIMIYVELKSGIHKVNSNREARFIDNIDEFDVEKKTKILIVDDSIDTGASVKAVYELISNRFVNGDIKIAGMNVWDKSSEVICTDFCMYRNTIIKAPMSKDSNEYETFLEMYKAYIN